MIQTNIFPKISILIPTLNSERVLELCLEAIKNQNYPGGKIEIIIADGGSTDKTLKIAKNYQTLIYHNPLKTGEAGKALALKHSTGELIALIDSDNILPEDNWLKKMIEPFSDQEIVGSEPWEFTYREKDGFIDRYCALMGINDPLCFFLGNYDRKNVLSGKWTGLEIEEKDKGEWLKIYLKPLAIPTLGANGTIFRSQILKENKTIKDYLFDIDVLADLVNKKPIKFAKVKSGIIHLYCGSSINLFIRKQRRRIRDYFYFNKNGLRLYPWQKQNKWGLLKFILACVTIIPLLFQSIKGYLKKHDPAWFFHLPACWITLGVYVLGVLESKLTPSSGRKNWKQR